MMKLYKLQILALMCAALFTNVVNAENAPAKGLKLGFAFDRGFGVTGAIGNLNGFIGNKGLAVDYIFKKDTLKLNPDIKGALYWYVGGGGYYDWDDDDTGVRLPVGAEWYFAKNLDAYAQLIPRLRVNNDAKFGLDAAVGVRYQF